MFPIRRFLSVLLSFLIALSCLPSPALAAEGVGFSDVDPDAWYAPYIDVCVKAGVMQGVGDERFEPEDDLSCREGAVMLLRLYDVLHGGDGQFPAPSEDWVPIWVEDEQGQVLYTGEDLAGIGWGRQLFLPLPQDRTLTQRTKAVIRLGGLSFTQPLSPREDGRAALELEGLSHRMQVYIEDAFLNVLYWDKLLPDWSRDAWYYAQCNGLDELMYLGGGFSADGFAAALDQACGELPSRFHAEYVPGFEREDDPAIYALREAGVWNWTNEALVHDQFGTPIFSRADAAVLIARVLDPELRLTQDPDALPHEGYTLAYLMEGQPPQNMPGQAITYPVIPLEDGLLTVTGEIVPWPYQEGTPSIWNCRQEGEYLLAAFYAPREPVRTDPRYGAAGCCRAPDLYGWIDGSGQLVGPTFSDWRATPPDGPVFERPYTTSQQGIYYDAEDRPVSQKFDWCGDLNQDLQGFVGLEGAVYRIEFAR